MVVKGGDMRISQVPWKPVERVPRSSTPVADEDSTPYRPRRSPSAHAKASANHEFLNFGAQSRGPRSRCVRFAAVVTHRRRNTRYQVVEPHPAWTGNFTRWVSLLSFCSWISYIRVLLSARACLAHRMSEDAGDPSELVRRPIGHANDRKPN